MRISDAVGGAKLSTLPEIGLVLFLSLFFGVVVYVLVVYQGKHLEEVSHLPLEDGKSVSVHGEKNV